MLVVRDQCFIITTLLVVFIQGSELRSGRKTLCRYKRKTDSCHDIAGKQHINFRVSALTAPLDANGEQLCFLVLTNEKKSKRMLKKDCKERRLKNHENGKRKVKCGKKRIKSKLRRLKKKCIQINGKAPARPVVQGGCEAINGHCMLSVTKKRKRRCACETTISELVVV